MKSPESPKPPGLLGNSRLHAVRPGRAEQTKSWSASARTTSRLERIQLSTMFSQERIWAQHSSAKCWPSLVFSFKDRMVPQVEIMCVWWSQFSKHKIRVILDSLPDVTASTIPRFGTVTQNTIQLRKECWECRLHHYHQGIRLSSFVSAALNLGMPHCYQLHRWVAGPFNQETIPVCHNVWVAKGLQQEDLRQVSRSHIGLVL